MTDLYLTPTRRALLRQVADSHVYRDLDSHEVDRDGYRVDARINELVRAGLVTLHPGDVVWRLTDTGRAALTTGDTP